MLGIEHLREAFEKRQPGYERGITVPAIVDVPSGKVVTNDFAQITLDLERVDGVPPRRRANNGVYEAGFAGDQREYGRAYATLFDRLDWLSERLAGRRYLMGDTITEADVRL